MRGGVHMSIEIDINNIIKDLEVKNEIKPNALKCTTNTDNSFSINIYSELIVKCTEKNNRLQFKNKAFKQINIPQDCEVKNLKSFPDFTILVFESISFTYFETIKELIQYYIDNYEPEDKFGCCDKYVECSDKLKCLHNDRLYAKACWYRKNLEAGRVFYGINKNN